jgi:hypothetical protein
MKQQKYLVQGTNDEWIMLTKEEILDEGYLTCGEIVYLITIESKFEVVEERKLRLEEIKIK